MVSFGHTAVGTIVGVVSYEVLGGGDIAIGLLTTGAIGVISHYLADFAPHGHFFREKDFKKYIFWAIILDLTLPIVSLILFAHFLNKSSIEILYILFGIGGAQLPDVITGLRTLDLLPSWKFFSTESNFHHKIHWHKRFYLKHPFNFTDIWQVLVFIFAVSILINS